MLIQHPVVEQLLRLRVARRLEMHGAQRLVVRLSERRLRERNQCRSCENECCCAQHFDHGLLPVQEIAMLRLATRRILGKSGAFARGRRGTCSIAICLDYPDIPPRAANKSVFRTGLPPANVVQWPAWTAGITSSARSRRRRKFSPSAG